jgi:hypothetical protein
MTFGDGVSLRRSHGRRPAKQARRTVRPNPRLRSSLNAVAGCFEPDVREPELFPALDSLVDGQSFR